MPEIIEKASLPLSTCHLIDVAQSYGADGWQVIPLHHPQQDGGCSCKSPQCSSPAKHPLTRNGLKDAASTLQRIREWWTFWPYANIGVLTGVCSGIVVLDVDSKNGGLASLSDLEAQHGKLPRTHCVKTSRGGLHLYFKHPGPLLRNRTNILPGLDFRGDGGYVVAPPSLHIRGERYEWLEKLDLTKRDFPQMPKWLVELVDVSSSEGGDDAAQCHAILDGYRNTTLTSIGGLMRRQGLSKETIANALISLNQTLCQPPLLAQEVNKIAGSVSRYKPKAELHLISATDWREPKQLPQLDQSVPYLDSNLLPVHLRPWLFDVAERMQVPLEFVAVPAIVALSSIIGRKVTIKPKAKDDWVVVPNLWGAIVARPGFFKSPTIAEALKPLSKLSSVAHAEYEAALVLHKCQEEIRKAKIEGIKERIKRETKQGNSIEIESLQEHLSELLTEQKEDVLSEKRYKTNDATVEKLAVLLNENSNGLMVVRDELYGWLKGLHKFGREGDREFYLEAWNGYGAFSVDRISRGTIHVPALCLSVVGGIQPGKLDDYVASATKGGKEDDGLLQRFQLAVYPNMPKNWKNIDRRPDEDAYLVAEDLFRSVDAISSEQQIALQFSNEAQELFDAWRDSLEMRLRSGQAGSPAFESHLAKYRSLMPSLALIFHLASVAREGLTEFGLISLEDTERSVRWCEFLESHARRIYGSALSPDIKAAHALASRIKSGQVGDGDKIRSIYRHHWALLDTVDKLETAISVLEKSGWVAVETIPVNNTTSDILRINPHLKF